MNQSIITGNLTAEVETRSVGEQQISRFTLACNEGERVIFMPVEAWNMPHLTDYLGKGSRVLVSGALKQDNWKTDSGEKRSRVLLNAFRVEFLDRAADPGSEARQRKSSTRSPSLKAPSRQRSVA